MSQVETKSFIKNTLRKVCVCNKDGVNQGYFYTATMSDEEVEVQSAEGVAGRWIENSTAMGKKEERKQTPAFIGVILLII